jgi:hypothetical protein
MTAFNAVRFRVKPGREQELLDAHKKVQANWPALTHANIIKTGDRTYCIIAEWTDMDALARARPNMIATLDSFRDALEDLGGGIGVNCVRSGSPAIEITSRAKVSSISRPNRRHLTQSGHAGNARNGWDKRRRLTPKRSPLCCG